LQGTAAGEVVAEPSAVSPTCFSNLSPSMSLEDGMREAYYCSVCYHTVTTPYKRHQRIEERDANTVE
jgi:hypothetical protein